MFIYDITPVSDPSHRLIISILSIFFMLLLLSSCRKKISFYQTCFDSIDRPEDRPKTLYWLTTQTLAGYFVLICSYIIFNLLDVPLQLLYLTILAVTIGDGLAEPIGVKFGKRRYPVKAFNDDRLYYRTLEGSATVYIASLIICLFFSSFFSSLNFIALILIFPLVITFIEAKSPHTWDTPFLFLGGNLSILLIYTMVRL
jgi:phytol kinase